MFPLLFLLQFINNLPANASSNMAYNDSMEMNCTHLDGNKVHFINEEECDSVYTPPSQRSETYVIAVMFILIIIVGVLGNGTLIIIFFRHRSMRNVPNTYILSLAIADLLVIVVCVPLATTVYTYETWSFGRTLCQVTEFFKDVSIGVSVFTLTALSGERYCAVVNPLRKLQTKPLTVMTAVMIWMLSILCATPPLIVSDLQVYEIQPNLSIYVCSPFGSERENLEIYTRFMVVTKAIIYYLLPLLIIGTLYLLMAKRLHMSTRELPGETLTTQSRSQMRSRRYLARMVIWFVIVFFVCFFPYHLFELWFYFNPTATDDFDDFWHIVRITGFCTSFLNSCINPVTLYWISGTFRAHFNRYLCCRCTKRQSVHTRQHSTTTGVMNMSSLRHHSTTSSSYHKRISLHANSTQLNVSNGKHDEEEEYNANGAHNSRMR
uniref:G-protein coupled receptors family 1 profile domain-containing protein n=1 Tax=Glossina pallidipes TaxID=7398 RepID=A0A1B0AGA2_GLOPL